MKKAVTLLELMIVIIIIGVLATIAIPSYNAAVETARGGEAMANLLIIRAAEKMYFVDNNEYYVQIDTSTQMADNTVWEENLGIENPNAEVGRSFDYGVGLLPPDDETINFRAYAVRRGSDPMLVITIEKDGNLGGNWPYPLR